jgi:hypothetical protein
VFNWYLFFEVFGRVRLVNESGFVHIYRVTHCLCRRVADFGSDSDSLVSFYHSHVLTLVISG